MMWLPWVKFFLVLGVRLILLRYDTIAYHQNLAFLLGLEWYATAVFSFF